ncbi:hypothetical protein FC83_GL001515 [Agrilactobacillus composti DSM 18527 = JCM 14202]|uniref:Uncharacterized protein n=1 Tax=Agrilactobacillus composti DSM 18527 = JCM 14202 TaxID=1423734 RepID=X0PMU5_9LACO|nr:hypothetical protein [Agrilactobacillus composti]KRM30384.1 hypothetical protein FC83_GL001515 [Agrilactobacillus composti DSM 18527 = JCM 14202]GAF38852.1 hypothetical protein JCM14202_683 [Agrilactobacillus composti DSM 18527 = JCM 14202]
MLVHTNQAKVDSLIYLFRKEIKEIFAMDDKLQKRGKLSRKTRKRVYTHHCTYSLHWAKRIMNTLGVRTEYDDFLEEQLLGPQVIYRTIDTLLFTTEWFYVDPKLNTWGNIQEERENLIENVQALLQEYAELPLATGGDLESQVYDRLR